MKSVNRFILTASMVALLLVSFAVPAFAVGTVPDYIGYDDVYWIRNKDIAANRSASPIAAYNEMNPYNVSRSYKAGVNALGVYSGGSDNVNSYESGANAGFFQAYTATSNSQSFQIDLAGTLQMAAPANPAGIYNVNVDVVYSLYTYDGTQWNFGANAIVPGALTTLNSWGSMLVDKSLTLNLGVAAGTDFVLGLELMTNYGAILWGGDHVSSFSNDFMNTMTLSEITGATAINATPIPGAAWLLGSGLIGLVGLRRRMRD